MRRRPSARLLFALAGCFSTSLIAIAAPACLVSTLFGSCDLAFDSPECRGGLADGFGTAVRFSSPYGVATTHDGRLLIADQDNLRVRVANLSSGSVSTLTSGKQLSFPTGVALDGAALFVADMDNHVIRRVEQLDGRVSTLAGSLGVAGFADGPRALFNLPTSVAAANGFVYVADYANQRVRRVRAATGLVDTLAGACGSNEELNCPGGYADGLGTSALFSLPSGVALSADAKTLYVAEERGNRIRAIRLSDGAVRTIAGCGKPGYVDGAGTQAAFSSPTGLAASIDGTLYVVDALNARIRAISSSGVVSTLAGGAEQGSADGACTQAAFRLPTGVAVLEDGQGGRDVFVVDSGGQTIRRIRVS
jgi:sugar lactone lactonase YvrE